MLLNMSTLEMSICVVSLYMFVIKWHPREKTVLGVSARLDSNQLVVIAKETV